MLNFIVDKMPFGVIVFNRELDVLYSNNFAAHFLERHRLPREVLNISGKMFEAVESGRLKELFPGEVYLTRKLSSSTSRWTFKFEIAEASGPFVCVFIKEDSAADRLDLNEFRRRYRLTRRDEDVLRQVLRGLKNREIAGELDISEQTVKEYLGRIYVKLGVRNRLELVSLLLNSDGKKDKRS